MEVQFEHEFVVYSQHHEDGRIEYLVADGYLFHTPSNSVIGAVQNAYAAYQSRENGAAQGITYREHAITVKKLDNGNWYSSIFTERGAQGFGNIATYEEALKAAQQGIDNVVDAPAREIVSYDLED